MTKVEEDFEFEDRKKRSLREKMFGSEEHQYLKNLNDKDNREIDGISRSVSAKHKSPELLTEAVRLGKTVGREALEYVPRKLKETRENIETNREYSGRYGVEYRKHKLELAETRAIEAEQRNYREKIDKEVEKIAREKAREDIAIAAEKTFRVTRAKTAGREMRKLEVQRQRQRNASPLDTLGIYSIYRVPSTRNISGGGNPITNNIFGGGGDPSAMNVLLGFQIPQRQRQNKIKNRKKQPEAKHQERKKRYNIFSGMWEWVE